MLHDSEATFMQLWTSLMAAIIFWAASLALVCLFQPLMAYIWDAKKLRRFPCQNPLSGITNFGYIVERYRGFRSKNLHKLHEESPIIRLGPNSLSFSSPDAIRAIYGHSTTCVKEDMYAAPAGPHSSLLEVISKQEHARKRRYMSHALATRNLITWESKVTDKVERLLCQFDRICNEAVLLRGEKHGDIDFRRWSNLFTVEAICDIALSFRLGCLDRGDDAVTIMNSEGKHDTVHYIDCLHAGKRATSMLVWLTNWFRLLKATLSMVPGYFRAQWAQGNQFDSLVRYLTLERIRRHQDGEELDDVVQSILMDKGGRARGLDAGEIEAEVGVLREYTSDMSQLTCLTQTCSRCRLRYHRDCFDSRRVSSSSHPKGARTPSRRGRCCPGATHSSRILRSS
jgi:benzoate 4-monooxygenase